MRPNPDSGVPNPKIDPSRRPVSATRPDGTPDDDDRVEIGPTELIRGVQATIEFTNLGGPVSFNQVPALLAGAIVAPWALTSTIGQIAGNPDNFVTVVHAHGSDQSIAALAGLVPLGLQLLNGNALPMGSVELVAATGGPVQGIFVPGADQLCSNVAENCVIENLGDTIETGVTVQGVPEPGAAVLMGLALAGLAGLRRRA